MDKIKHNSEVNKEIIRLAEELRKQNPYKSMKACLSLAMKKYGNDLIKKHINA